VNKGEIDLVAKTFSSVPPNVRWVVALAAKRASDAHRGQTRKGSGDPFFVHPDRVAKAVGKYVSPEAIAAAYLHDVVEDTDCWDLSSFPSRVRELVRRLTKCPAETKESMICRIGNSMDHEAILIKVADRTDNLLDSVSFGNSWVRKYARGAHYLHQKACDAGLANHSLVKKLKRVANAALLRSTRKRSKDER
jgi:(p)ppGpp synthase/HD superfamily hydrolase